MTSVAALPNEPMITNQVVAEHGLSEAEYSQIQTILGRTPNLTELGIFSVMWSEHCSYKTTRNHLAKLPTTGKQVICGPGENAGVIDLGDSHAAIFKMESHNHPTFIEPHQGAATGVGGILRDVFTMGARPIALMNALRFGDPAHSKTRHIMRGAVAGIGHYGNCVGVPTVGGEVNFHPAYNGNPLVNAMCVGLAEKDKIFYAKASGVGNPVLYVGAKTGRDGIHGATMASAEFDENTEEKRPTVQVGDPFTEKLLIEACLELMATDAIIAIQDMGAAGLTCSSLEMAGKGDLGMKLNLDHVPIREAGMTPYEIMLSESQERMLMVIKPEREELAFEIFRKWELDVATVGELTNTGHLEVFMHGEKAVDIPVAPLSEAAPRLNRPYTIKKDETQVNPAEVPATDIGLALKNLLMSPDIASRRWVWEQYDHMVMNDTVVKPGSDAAVVRIHGTQKAVAISTDVTPRYCFADPVEGGKQAVVETYRNIIASGAQPLAITNCLNFGNPEKEEIMGQLVGCLQGMSEACEALNYPVVSGNVSMYNETHGEGILPTPAIGGVGLMDDIAKAVPSHFTPNEHGDAILMLGTTKGHLGQSLYLRELIAREEGAPPPVNLSEEFKIGQFIHGLASVGLLSACHDVSDGGMLVALAEMCMPQLMGAEVSFANDAEEVPNHAYAFGEDQGRYIIAVPQQKKDEVVLKLNMAEIPFDDLGEVTGQEKAELHVNGLTRVPVAHLKETHEAWLPGYMAV